MRLMWGDAVEPLPSFATKSEVTVSRDIFDEYVGEYAFTPALSLTVTRVEDRFFVQPTGHAVGDEARDEGEGPQVTCRRRRNRITE